MKRDRLDLLNGLRQRRLDACRLQLASVSQCEGVLESRLRELARAARSILEEQRQAVGAGGVDVGCVAECRRRRQKVQGALGLLARRRALVDEVAGLARTNLEEAVRQVEVIEKLSERVSG